MMMSEEHRVARVTDSQPEEEKPFICAWCPDFDPKNQEKGVSHGMCRACATKMAAQNMQDVTFEKLVARIMCLLP
jgi:hypothetical protein